MFTLDSGIVFDPLDLSIDVTPEAVMGAIKSHDLLTAIVLSFRLGDQKLLQKSVEAVAPSDGMYWHGYLLPVLYLYLRAHLA